MNEYEHEVDRGNSLANETPQNPAQERLMRDASLYPDEMVVPVTSDGFESSVDVYGADVVNTGMASDASVRGFGADLDAMPGDETPISRPPGGNL